MDTPLEAILRVMLNNWELIESGGDLNDYHTIYGYCVFDAGTIDFITKQYSDVIDSYGNPFAGDADYLNTVYYVTMNDSGIINFEVCDSISDAERIHSTFESAYDRFNQQDDVEI